MFSYFLKRLLNLIPLLLGITIISFAVIHLAPGRPAYLKEMDPRISLEAQEQLIKLYDLDKPLFKQYLNWLKRVLRLDFGNSFVDGRKVIVRIRERLPVTLLINILSMVLIIVVALPIGVISALKPGGLFDKWTTFFVFLGFSLPGFWLALLLMLLLGIKLNWLPISGLKSFDYHQLSFWGKNLDIIKHLILPVSVTAFGGLAGFSRYVRGNMIGVLKQNYIRAAYAQGINKGRIVYKYALKNALLPLITILGLSIPGLIGGSVIFESIFAIPGMGRLLYNSAVARDYPMIMGGLVIGAVLTLLGNLLADLCYAWADPRIKCK
ncbi:MAG: diguanylate cyclase [Candidatus Omnitrophica bacterium 4484_213]|nr:MAG: diguanylate cyclase [Candidatus Omnitrophica bacterium 4484_213]